MSHQHRITRSRASNAPEIVPAEAGGAGEREFQAARAPLGNLTNGPEASRGVVISAGGGPRCLDGPLEEARGPVGGIAVEVHLLGEREICSARCGPGVCRNEEWAQFGICKGE